MTQPLPDSPRVQDEDVAGAHLQQSPAVAERFARLRSRPVMLELRGVTCAFPNGRGSAVALKDIDLTVHRREFLCVIGPSGCGKSTLARVIAGLQPATSGRLRVDGQTVTGPGPDRGMVFQSYTLFPWLTLERNVMFGLEMQGRPEGKAQAEARQWLDLVGLKQHYLSYPHQLSGGMKQRVAIARALAAGPKVLLMDEPFGALDPTTRAQMQAHLLEIWRHVDITIVFITHDMDEAILLADRILVLKAHPGEVQEHFDVPVPRPRSVAQFSTPEFQATRRHLDRLIHPVPSPTRDPLPIFRLTQAGDDVE